MGSSESTGRPIARGLAGLHPRLGDFGLVKFFGSEGQELVSGSLGSQPWLGTPAYMAPEQVQHRSSELGPPTDVHALGVVLYELLIGKPLFGSSDVLKTVQRVVSEEPKKLRLQRRDVPRDLETICLKCLAKDPRGRYASAGDLALDLQRFLAGESIRARRPSASLRAFRWLSDGH